MHELAEGIESGGPYYIATMTETIASKNIKKLESDGIVFCDIARSSRKARTNTAKDFWNEGHQTTG